MADNVGFSASVMAWSVNTHAMSIHGNSPRLVDSDPVFDTIAEGLKAYTSILSECIHRVALIHPTTIVFVNRQREIPVEKSRPRFNIMFQESIYEIVVK